VPRLFKLPVSTLVAALLLDANSPLQARLDLSGCPQSFHLQAAAIPLAGKRQVIVNFQVIRDRQIPKLAGVVKRSAPRRRAPPLTLSARRASRVALCSTSFDLGTHTLQRHPHPSLPSLVQDLRRYSGRTLTDVVVVLAIRRRYWL
ncbi:hypothetical protein C8F01DRAFT_1177089, partial [Mycena amicta]